MDCEDGLEIPKPVDLLKKEEEEEERERKKNWRNLLQ